MGRYEIRGSGPELVDWPHRRGMVAAWVDEHGWESMDSVQRIMALSHLKFLGGTTTEHFSVRWQGVLTAPNAGAYTFARRFVPARANDWMKVWIGEELVLDTSNADFVPPEVRLPANAVAIKVEHARDVTKEFWPVSSAVLGWQTGEGGVVTVPASAFKTAVGGAAGLSAQYFDDPAFQTSFAQRVDPSIDQVWDGTYRPRAAADRVEARRGMAGWAKDPAVIASFFVQTEGPEVREADFGLRFAGTYVGFVMKNLGGVERDAFARWLMTRPDLLVHIKEYALAELLRLAVPVSEDGKLQADLLVAWTNAQPRKTTVLDSERFPQHGYLRLNWDGLAHCAKALSMRRGEHVSLASYDYLLDEVGLAKADGTPNLRMIPVLTYASKISGYRPRSDVKALIDAQLKNEAITGDKRALWLVARAMYEENSSIDTPNVMRGHRQFELAFAEAESEAVRFWALSELVVRQISVGEEAAVGSLLDSVEGQFSPEGVVQGATDAEGQPITYAAQFQSWRNQAHVFVARVAQAREARLFAEDLSRARGDIADLEHSIAELEALQDDPRRGDAVRRLLARARQDLSAAKDRLEVMENEGVGQ